MMSCFGQIDYGRVCIDVEIDLGPIACLSFFPSRKLLRISKQELLLISAAIGVYDFFRGLTASVLWQLYRFLATDKKTAPNPLCPRVSASYSSTLSGASPTSARKSPSGSARRASTRVSAW